MTGEKDHHILLDAADDDWAWRRRIRGNRASYLAYRTFIGVAGLVVTVVGLVLVPAPGPGWLIVFAGVAIWASEFEWAQNVLRSGRRVLKTWTDWMGRQPVWVRGLVGLATLVLVLAIFWSLLRLTGVPGFFPDTVEDWLTAHAGLG